MGFLGTVLDRENRAFGKMERSLAEIDHLLSSSSPSAAEKLELLVAEIKDTYKDISSMKSEFSSLISKVALREVTLKKFNEAIEVAHIAEELDKNNADAKFSSSIALRHGGKFEEALSQIDAAIKLGPKEKRFRMEKGRILQARGDIKGASDSFMEASKIDPTDMEIFRMVIELNPKDVSYMAAKGKTLVSLRKYPDAVKAYEDAIQFNAEDVPLWLGKAEALLADGRMEESMQAVTRALAIDPKSADAWEMKARVLKGSGKAKEAIAALKKGTESDPKNKALWNEIGLLESAAKDFDAAIEAFDNALAASHDDIAVLRNKKVALQALGKNEEVEACCSKIIAANPSDVRCRIDKGDAEVQLKKFDAAYESFKEAHSLSKDDIAIVKKLNDIAKSLGRPEDVLSWSDEILKRYPDDVQTLHDRGVAQIGLNRHYDAVKSLEKASKIDPSSVAVLDSLKEALKMLGNDKGIIDTADRVIRIDPHNKLAFHDKAVALEHMHDLPRALDSYRQAFTIDPGDKIVAYDFSVALYRSTRYDECADVARRALERVQDEPRLWRILGETELARRRPEEALKALDKSLALDANDKGAQFTRGLALMELKKFEAAAAEFGKVVKADAKDADATFQLGSALMQLDRPKEALDCFTKVSALRPQDVVPLTLQGDVLLKMGKPRDSLAPLVGALRISPNSMDALRLLKNAMVSLKDNEGTIRVCNDILRLNPRDVETLTDKGKASMAMGDMLGAIASFDLALAVHPDDLVLLGFKMTCLIRIGDFENIIRNGARILMFVPGDRQTLVEMALANEKLDRYDEAVRIYDDIIAQNPKDTDIVNRKGEVLMIIGRPEEAAEAFMAALNMSKRSGLLLNNYGKALLAMRKVDDALEVFRHAIEQDQVNAEYRVNEGRCLAALDRLDEALKSFDTALSLDRYSYQALKYRGAVLVKLKRFDEAIGSFEKTLEIAIGDREVYWNLGMACEMLGRTREAIAHYQELLRHFPADPNAWQRIGELLYSMGEHREAIDSYDRGLSITPDDYRLWIGKGRALDALGMSEDALQSYDRAIGINPDVAEAWRLKGAVLMTMERGDNAMRAYQQAMTLDPTDSVAKKGLQESDAMVRQSKIDDYARAVLEFEHAHRRPVNKEEAFRIAGIPYAFLDDVMAYIDSRVEMDVAELGQEEIDAYEEASREILVRAYNDRTLEGDGLTLADIVRNFPEYRIPTAKRILVYIQKVSRMTFPKTSGEDPKLEYMLRSATSLPEAEKTVVGVMRNLNVGIMQARRIVSILQTFKGVGGESQSVSLKSVISEGYGMRIPEDRGTAFADERTLRQENVEESRSGRRPGGNIDMVESQGVIVEPALKVPREMRGETRGHHAAPREESGLDRDVANLDGRRCLFHGGVAVARCTSCKAVLCNQCLRGVDKCPRCGAPFTIGPETDSEELEPEENQPHVPKHQHHEEQRDFSRL
jgi:tetratricopeptide (TPR) repeat protein